MNRSRRGARSLTWITCENHSGMTVDYELSDCPACGGPDTTEVASAEEIEREMEALWEFHTRRLRPDTPAERLADRVVFSQPLPVRIGRCGSCGLLYRNPRVREHELVAIYGEEGPSQEALTALLHTQRETYRAQARRLTRINGQAGHVLEVGSFAGGFLAAAAELGWRATGIDVSRAAVDFACASGFTASEAQLEEVEQKGLDAIAIWNTFEQLPDPRATLQAARERLAPGGLLALRVPNGAFYQRLHHLSRGPIGAAARGLLAHNNLLGFPYRHGFSPASLGQLLERAGMQVVATHPDTLVRIADRWTRRWARFEERLTKRVLRMLPGTTAAPWFEMYARKPPPG